MVMMGMSLMAVAGGCSGKCGTFVFTVAIDPVSFWLLTRCRCLVVILVVHLVRIVVDVANCA